MNLISVLFAIALGLLVAFGPVTQTEKIQAKSELLLPNWLEKGMEAPEIEGESPKGKKFKLSSLRGKYVLIDFWASWCGPCRHENPNVVSAYEKYNKAKLKDGKGFEVFSVSLDKEKKRWQRAIEKDGLKWKYHVSDLKGWNSDIAKSYGVKSIPYSILIDPEGKVIATNLRGMDLHIQMDEFVEEF